MLFCSFFIFAVFSKIVLTQIHLTNYTYDSHGSDWNISVCLTNFRQSPIDIYSFNITTYSNLHYFFAKYHPSVSTANYTNVSLILQSNDATQGYGTLLTVVPDSRGSKKAFQAQNILFRAPAEHVINGTRFPLEVQIYHKLEKASFTQYAAVSLFFNVSQTSNGFLDNIISNNKSNTQNFSVDLSTLLNFQSSDDLEYWAYQGSLTMPTCDENTNWYLIKQIFGATEAQINYFSSLYHNNPNFKGDGNYRELQTGNRTKNVIVMDFKRN